MVMEQTVDALKKLLIPKLSKIVEMMHMDSNPLLVTIPEDASHLSEDKISELIAEANNAVNKASEWCGAAYAAFKLCEHSYELTYKSGLRNEGKNEDERTAIAMTNAADDRQKLQIAESCYRYMQAIYTACEINSQSARKLVDNFHGMRRADSRETTYGKTPDKGAKA